MGAAIALDLALRSSTASADPMSGRVLGMVLIGGGAQLPVSPHLLQELQQDAPRAISMIVNWAYGRTVSPELKRLSVERLSLIDPAILRDDFRACGAFDVSGKLDQIATPSLILCGVEDRMTPPAYSQALHERLRCSQLLQVEGAGHMVTFEQTEVAASAIIRFLDTLSPLGDLQD